MFSGILRGVGIDTRFDIPASEIFSGGFDIDKYGLSDQDKKQIAALKQFVTAYNREVPVSTNEPVSTCKKAAELMRHVFRGQDKEEAWVVLLNSCLVPLSKHKVNVGLVNQTLIDKRAIVKLAIEHGATSVILYHNHLSGNPSPSIADVKTTEEIRSALELFEITLCDHIIISDTKFYSFSEERNMIF